MRQNHATLRWLRPSKALHETLQGSHVSIRFMHHGLCMLPFRELPKNHLRHLIAQPRKASS